MTGFQSKIAIVATSDGRNVKLIEPIDYISVLGVHYRIPRGVSSDGISAPAVVRPSYGKDWLAGLLHDAGYSNTLLVVETSLAGFESTHAANLTKDQCDNLLREAALSLGDSEAEADELYWGVSVGGYRSFSRDRSG